MEPASSPTEKASPVKNPFSSAKKVVSDDTPNSTDKAVVSLDSIHEHHATGSQLWNKIFPWNPTSNDADPIAVAAENGDIKLSSILDAPDNATTHSVHSSSFSEESESVRHRMRSETPKDIPLLSVSRNQQGTVAPPNSFVDTTDMMQSMDVRFNTESNKSIASSFMESVRSDMATIDSLDDIEPLTLSTMDLNMDDVVESVADAVIDPPSSLKEDSHFASSLKVDSHFASRMGNTELENDELDLLQEEPSWDANEEDEHHRIEETEPQKEQDVLPSALKVPELQTPGKSKTGDRNTLQQFDPLIPVDWMISFDSPSANKTTQQQRPVTAESQESAGSSFQSEALSEKTKDVVSEMNASTSNNRFSSSANPELMIKTPLQLNKSRSMHKTPQQQISHHSLLIETLEDLATPTSVIKYSQRDMERMKREVIEKFEKEFELAQLELLEIDNKRKDALEENARIQNTLDQWEKVMQQMIANKKQAEEDMKQQLLLMKASMDKVVEEKERILKESELINRKYKQIRIDFEDMKESESKLRTENTTLQEQLTTWKTNYDKLKGHAEKKIEEANTEINKVRETFDKESSTLKAKLLRAELNVNSLEKLVESKTKENTELSKICDELLAQIEKC